MSNYEDCGHVTAGTAMSRAVKALLNNLTGFFYLPFSSTSQTEPSSRGHLKLTECNQAANVYHLSERGAYNSCFRDIWGPREKLALETWSNNNPGGW